MMTKDELVEKTTSLICTMMVDFQSRTPENPITREDIRSYVEQMFSLEEEEESDPEEQGSSGTVLIWENVQSASSW